MNSFYMAVLLPGAINWDDNAVIGIRNSNERIFPDIEGSTITFGQFYRENYGLDVSGTGRITKGDAVQSVIRRRDTYFYRKE